LNSESWVGLVVGLLGAVAAIGAAIVTIRGERRLRLEERHSRRKALATTLMVQLRSIEIGLRGLAVHPLAASDKVITSMSLFERFTEADASILTPSAVTVLEKFRGRLREIVESRRTIERVGMSPSSDDHHWVQTRAALAANMVTLVRRALLDAGSEYDGEDEMERVMHPRTVPLSSPAFPQYLEAHPAMAQPSENTYSVAKE
jgi:hypothetical protein